METKGKEKQPEQPFDLDESEPSNKETPAALKPEDMKKPDNDAAKMAKVDVDKKKSDDEAAVKRAKEDADKKKKDDVDAAAQKKSASDAAAKKA